MGPAAIGIGIGSTLLGAYSARKQRKAAQRQADSLSQPQNFSQTTERTPYGPTSDLIDMLLGQGAEAFNAPMPDFPGFFGFGGVEGFPDYHGIDFLGYQPELTEITDTPYIHGAGESLRELGDLRALIAEDPYLPGAGEAIEDIFEGPSEQFDMALNYLIGGPLARTARGEDLTGRFDDSVANVLQRDAQELLENQIGQIRGNATSVGRSGPEATGALEAQAAQDARQDILSALAAVRAGSFESGEQRRLAAGESVSQQLGGLAGLRSQEVLGAAGTAADLERARFIGPGLAAQTAGTVDTLGQNKTIFEASFGQRERERAQRNLLALLSGQEQSFQFGAGLDAQKSSLEAQLGARAAQARNAYELQKFGYEENAPFSRLQQLASLVLPFASQFGSTTTSGTQQRNYLPQYTPSMFEGGLAGLFSGAQLAGGLGLLDGGGKKKK